MAVNPGIVKNLKSGEMKLLRITEELMHYHEWVPVKELIRLTHESKVKTWFRLELLAEKGLVKLNTTPYEGCSLLYTGYDTLALSTIVRHGTVQSLGDIIGEGKESVVYEAFGFGPVILKFHHIGNRSFHNVRLVRDYLPESGHLPWVIASKFSAEREYNALKRLHPEVRVPIPIDISRNTIVMSQVFGRTMNSVILLEPEGALEFLIENIACAFGKGVIHGDLSEYNIMIDEKGPVIIDWPQWIETSHPNADDVLTADIRNLLNFFRKKYLITKDPETVKKRVQGK